MSAATDESSFRVRVARAGDAASLADLCTQLGYPSKPAEVAERLESIFGAPDHMVFVAELEGGRVAGFLHAYSGVILETEPRAHILGLVADSTARGRGIGRKLVAEAEHWAKSRGLKTLTVHCNVVRTGAHAFYERLGFECTKTQKHFSKQI